jgi:hypothetical protein
LFGFLSRSLAGCREEVCHAVRMERLSFVALPPSNTVFVRQSVLEPASMVMPFLPQSVR